MFKAAGVLLPMGFGQGPGQANNVGATYEAFGFVGGQSFGLSIAAAGYICACIVGVFYINYLCNKGMLVKTNHDEISGSMTIDEFQDENEIPIAESIDRLSIQAALVALIYLLTYLVTRGVVVTLEKFAPGLASMVSTLLWGFNFIVGSLIATGCRSLFGALRRAKVMNRQYQNNYLLSRISGVAFDFMIVAGIASIEINDLKGNWLPFLLMAVIGGVVTFCYLLWMCKKLYPNYVYEGFFSMFGMLTGTISSGVLLLREIDPELSTPASNNLVTGSSFGIIFGAPVLLLVSFAAKGRFTALITLGLVIVYMALLLLFIFKAHGRKKA
jgi:ESS family glutamate:Na+ symporter